MGRPAIEGEEPLREWKIRANYDMTIEISAPDDVEVIEVKYKASGKKVNVIFLPEASGEDAEIIQITNPT